MMAVGRTRRRVVHAGQETVLGSSDVGQHIEIERTRQLESPVSLAFPHTARQPLRGGALFQVPGIEVHCVVRPDTQRDRLGCVPGVVVGLDLDRAGRASIDDPHESLPRLGVRGGREQVDAMQRSPIHRLLVVRPRGEIGQVPGRALQQTGDLDGLVRGDQEPPLAVAVPETIAVESATRLQVRSGDGTGLAGCQDELRRVLGGLAAVVDARDAHGRVLGASIDQPQRTHLVDVAAGIEHRHRIAVGSRRHQVVQAGQEAVGSAHVGQHLHALTAHFQTPVATRRSDAPRQSFAEVAVLKVVRVEMGGRERIEREGGRAAAAGIVERIDVYDRQAPVVGHPHEALPGLVACRREHRHVGAGPIRIRNQPQRQTLGKSDASRRAPSEG